MIDLFRPKEGSLGTYVPYWGFVADDVILTVDGQLLFFAEIVPATVDGLAPHELDVVTQAWQKLLGSLDSPHRAFFVFDRPHVDPDLEHFEGEGLAMLVQRKRRAWVADRVRHLKVYLVVAFNPGLRHHVRAEQSGWPVSYLRNWIQSRQRVDHLTFYLREVIDRVVNECRTIHTELLSLVEDVTPVHALDANQIGEFLFRLVNQGQGEWVLMDKPMPYGLNWRIAGEIVAFDRKFMTVGDRLVGLFSMALPPQRSSANALGELYALPYDYTAVIEWRPVDKGAALSRIRSVQKHANTQRFSFWAALSGTEGTEMALDDAPSSAAVDQLYRAALELDTVGVTYGDLNLSLAVSASDQSGLDQVGALLQRVFTQQDGKLVKERFGQAAVWFQRFPGQRLQPLARPIFVSSGQAAALAPLFGGASGVERSPHLGKPCLTLFQTRWATSYGFDLFAGKDVGHTIIFGATGSGKSFWLNFLLLQSLQYHPKVLILDLGGSYRSITTFLQGQYISMNLETGDEGEEAAGPGAPARAQALPSVPGLKPFGLPPSERTFEFLVRWIERLLELGKVEPTADERNDIRKRVEDVYAYPLEERTLWTLVRSLPPRFGPPLARWVAGGAYAGTFDGPPDDDLDFNADWTVVDLAGAQEHPDWCTAALFFLFQRFRLVIDDDAQVGRLKLLVVDEAWRYLADPAVLTALTEAAKTWRKRNAALILATQSVVDITQSDMARSLLETLPTKVFLSNPDFPRSAAEVLQLSESEYETIRTLQAKREFFLYRSTEKNVLRIEVDPETYWLATSSPNESALRARMVAKYGLTGALVRLAAGQTDDDAGRREVLG